MYAIPNRKMTGEVFALPAVWETPVRTGNLRDPKGPQAAFASESFIDEVAAAAKADALEFLTCCELSANPRMKTRGCRGLLPLLWEIKTEFALSCRR